MSFPSFYKPEKVGVLYRPQISQVIEAASDTTIRPAREDKRRILLLLVDPQVDFVHRDGSLCVPGAIEDTRRTIEWLFNNLEQVTDIVASLDSHFPIHIFYPGWWVNEEGRYPKAMTAIKAQEVDEGRWRPVFKAEWSRYYVHELERKAKKTLLIWPYHTLIGTPGHSITPALYEAISYHSTARGSEMTHVVKGRIAKTEHYSLLEPEIKVPGEPGGGLNTRLLDRMATYNLIYIAGQAKSHCVLETVTSIINYADVQPGLVRKLRLLTDCMSSVAHPDIDFEALAEEKFMQFGKQGLQRVSVDDPLG